MISRLSICTNGLDIFVFPVESLNFSGVILHIQPFEMEEKNHMKGNSIIQVVSYTSNPTKKKISHVTI